jgi:enamine deaminase RidA (YjgF/YER057c/UK114 family)
MTIGSILSEQTAMKFSATRAGEGQAFLVASAQAFADAEQATGDAYARIAEVLREQKLAIVHERIFGSLSVECSVMAERHHALQAYGVASDNPVTYIEGNPPWGEGFAGAIIHAVAPNSADGVWTITDNGMPCGRGWRRNGSTYIMLQNIQGQGRERLTPPILPLDKERSEERLSCHSLSKPTQTRLMLERAESILRENNASYKDVARTWLYLSEILEWYPEFNKARSEKYGEFGIMPGPGDTTLLLPASTGIGADTPSGSAASMDLLAVVENGDAPSPVKKLTNMKQLDAFRYGAAFSRGAVIKEDEVNIIQISGTAAIDQQGRSQFPGDIRSQINCTFDKIDALLKQEGAGLADICAATVFVKRPEYAELFWQMAADRGLEDFPAVCVVADVCREELLFEIDAEAVVIRKGVEGSRIQGSEWKDEEKKRGQGFEGSRGRGKV